MVMENGEDAVIFVSADMPSITAHLLRNVVETLKKEAPEIPADKIIEKCKSVQRLAFQNPLCRLQKTLHRK